MDSRVRAGGQLFGATWNGLTGSGRPSQGVRSGHAQLGHAGTPLAGRRRHQTSS